MSDPITIEDIQRSTGLSERAVRGWISRLSVIPVGIRERAHLYPPTVCSDIQAAQIQSGLARRRPSRAIDGDAVAEEAADLAAGVITVAEAKRRAGRRTS